MEKEIEDLISKLTDDFGKSVSQEEKERENLIEAFEKYMHFAVKTLQESESKFIQKDTESIKSVLNRVAKNLIEENITSKKRELLEDKPFEEIRKISVEIFGKAKNKMNGEEVEKVEDIEAKTKDLNNLLGKVQEYNRERAAMFISDAQIDLQYITSEKEVDALSLRLYHYKKEMLVGKR